MSKQDRKQPTTASAKQKAAQALVDQSRRRLIVVAVTVLCLLIVAGGIVVISQFHKARSLPTTTSTPTRTVALAPMEVANGKPLSFGRGPKIMKIYFDTHCSHCQDLEKELGPTINRAVTEDRVTLQIYPMAFIDEGSRFAANGLGCAASAGFGWTFYETMWQKPEILWTEEQVLSVGKSITQSTAREQFETCVKSKSMASWVDSINKVAETDGVTGTPAVFLDGKKLELKGLKPQQMEELVK